MLVLIRDYCESVVESKSSKRRMANRYGEYPKLIALLILTFQGSDHK